MPQSRKWQLTFNNPADHGFTHDAITAAIENLASVVYWCMCDEVGSEGTYHTHLYICFQNPKAHTVIANAFPGAHRENVKGTSQQNRDYVLKDGEKYNKQPDGSYDYVDGSGKRHTGTNYTDTFLEWGELPHEHQGKSKDVEKILALLKDGADNLEIVDQVPSAMLNIDKVERTRSMYRDKQFSETWRELEVTYIFGHTGAGKTRSVMDTYGYANCYRVTDYRHPFDTYDGQDVLIFEEFRSSLKHGDMLNYLDGYPLLLGAETTRRPYHYSAKIAQDYAKLQATAKGQNIKLGHNHAYANYVSEQIQQGRSPDQITGTLRKENRWTVSTPTLYRYIDKGYIPNVTNKDLHEKPHRKRPYRHTQATRPPKGTSIERRPKTIGTRQTFGHWELDSVIGKSKGKNQSLLVLTERKTRCELILRAQGKTSAATVQALNDLLPAFPTGTFKTITVDNGSEFQDCHGMEHDTNGNKRLTVYYCHPYTSCERGSNERNNRIIRRYLPKAPIRNACSPQLHALF